MITDNPPTARKTLRDIRASLPTRTFAGFTWPRVRAIEPRAPLAARLDRYKRRTRLTKHYDVADLRYAGQGAVLFLDSDLAPGLRWKWCDEVSDAICPTGWFTDPGDEDETIRGIVMRLPHGRGFLAGWSMGEGMPSVFDEEIHHDETDAAHAADNMAERAREYQEGMDAEFVEA